MFTKPEPCAFRRAASPARSARRRRPARAAAASPLKSTNPSGSQPVGDAGLVDERRLEHDDEIRVGDRVVPADRPVGDASERAQRRAAALRAVLRERLDALAVAQQREREDLGGRLGALAGARVPADLGHVRSSQRLVERANRALRLRHGLDDARAAVDGVSGGKDLRVRRPARPRRPPRAASRNSSRGRWPIALTTVSTGMTNSLPGTGSGRRRPLSSGAPSRISAQRTPSTRSSPTNRDGAREEADLDALVRARARPRARTPASRARCAGRAAARRRRRAASPRPRRRPRCCRRR